MASVTHESRLERLRLISCKVMQARAELYEKWLHMCDQSMIPVKITSVQIISTKKKKKLRISNHTSDTVWQNKEFGLKWKMDIDV